MLGHVFDYELLSGIIEKFINWKRKIEKHRYDNFKINVVNSLNVLVQIKFDESLYKEKRMGFDGSNPMYSCFLSHVAAIKGVREKKIKVACAHALWQLASI